MVARISCSPPVDFASRLLIAAALWFAASAGLAHDIKPGAAAPPTPQERRTQAHALTDSLIVAAERLLSAPSIEHRRREAELLAIAEARFTLFSSMLQEDPGAVLDAALPGVVRSGLPSAAAPYIEQDAELDGSVEIRHEDWPDGGRYHYLLHSTRGPFSLHFAGPPPEHLATGAKIRVRGVQIEDRLALGGGGGTVQQLAPAPALNVLGEQPTLVILINPPDNPAQPFTPAKAQSVVFGTTSQFFLENSFQQAWLTGDVAGWFTTAQVSTVCDADALASEAKSAATAAGLNLAAYAHLVYVFPQNDACGWAGLSSVGGYPSQSWINGTLDLHVIAHELGHSMGLWHSHALECGSTTLCATGATVEYGDDFDAMGAIGGSFAGHFNAFQKERLGWLTSGGAPLISSVTANGTYVLDAYESAGAGPKALKILKSTDASSGQRTWYYVEFRQAIGFDGYLDDWYISTNALDGILVHTGAESTANSSHILDMTAATSTNWWFPALVAGQTFQDPDTGLTITTDSATSSGAAVTVRLGTSVSSAATVRISTNQATYSRGQTVLATAKVTSDGASMAGVAVKFSIVKSSGAVVTATATTGSDGTALYKLRLRKQDPVGTYQAGATATTKGLTISGNTTFEVN